MQTFTKLEFHRNGIALLNEPGDSDPGTAMYLEKAAGSSRPLRFCSCAVGRRKTCKHLSELGKHIKAFRKAYRNRSWVEIFAPTLWHRLAEALFVGHAAPVSHVLVQQIRCNGKHAIRFCDADGEPLLDYLDQSPAALRFLERTAKISEENGFAPRAALIDKLGIFLRTPEEQHLNRAGMQTNRQAFESSLWHRFAYHCFREFGDLEAGLDLGFTKDGAAFQLLFSSAEDEEPLARLHVPREQVARVLRLLDDEADERVPQPVLGESLFRTIPDSRFSSDLLLALGPVLEEESAYLEGPELDRRRYGALVLLPEAEILVDTEATEDPRPATLRQIEAARAPLIAAAEIEVVDEPKAVLTDPVRDLRILREFDWVEISATDSANEDSVEVSYGFRGERIPMRELVLAKRRGHAYLETASGWIDLSAPELHDLNRLSSKVEGPEGDGGELKLSSAELLRLKTSTSKPVHVESSDRSRIIARLLEMKPSQPLGKIAGLRSELRDYQRIGVEWLHFLYENRLAGLLCDDMGLGKTHQAMALMLLIREQHGADEPMLVVCPRTVISHWRNKLHEHAPSLRVVIHHGPQRKLEESLADCDVLLLSYGVLRNDIDELQEVDWALVVFDEVQQIKNQETLAYRAAVALKTPMKLGMTGTPIENSLGELKNLFDLILPGYLGDEDDYRDRFGSGSDSADPEAIGDLRRLISPFVLRRLKDTVLDELPEKIEDVQTCSLSDEQRQLYRDAIATRGAALIEQIRTDKQPLPYIHIFALLNLLKQICDHPALAMHDVENYEKHESRKWDLFLHLLLQGLDSGRKVVVFSQYLGMISMMQAELAKRHIGHVTLTGSTVKRGDVVDRFNNEPDARVFLGSLRAGGTGIDLIGGSIVIHYDRWWNAAKEDQATDRVYRIGQKRAVQVFKLVTEDTLEERIAAMIERKRQLLSEVVQADHPQLGKIFSRDELLELLRQVE